MNLTRLTIDPYHYSQFAIEFSKKMMYYRLKSYLKDTIFLITHSMDFVRKDRPSMLFWT